MRGLVAAFPNLDELTHAIEELKKKRLGDFTVYTATPRHEIDHAIDAPVSVVRKFTLIGGLLGVSFGYWIAIWASAYWPLVVGGKAIKSWIPYTIFGFEVMVLIGALSTVFGMFAVARIPNVTAFVGYDGRFSGGDYGIWLKCPPEKNVEGEQLLRKLGAAEVRVER